MTRWKRLFYYLLINILVSACTTLVVLNLWTRNQPSPEAINPVIIGRSGEISPPTLTAIAALNPGETIIITSVVTVVQTPITPYPTRGVVTYRVKAGDTLSGIARLFDVSQASLMDLNGITDPNVVVADTELLIPALPTPTATATATPEGTPASTATPTLTSTPPQSPTPTPSGSPSPPQVRIDAVIGAGDLSNERVVIGLAGNGEVSLLAWRLQDQDGNSFTFPQLILHGGALVSVYSGAGQTSVNALYWNLAQPVWRSGEQATLLDAQGQVQATFTVP